MLEDLDFDFDFDFDYKFTCSICLDPIYDENYKYVTSCAHHFHYNCLMQWCYFNNSCPECRVQNIMDISVSTFNTNNLNLRYDYSEEIDDFNDILDNTIRNLDLIVWNDNDNDNDLSLIDQFNYILENSNINSNFEQLLLI